MFPAGARSPSGKITWVTSLLVLALAAGGYGAWVFGIPYEERWQVERVLALAADKVYTQRESDDDVKSYIVGECQRMGTRTEVDPVSGNTQSYYLVDVNPDDIQIVRQEHPAEIIIRIRWIRKVWLPIFNKWRYLQMSASKTMDASNWD